MRIPVQFRLLTGGTDVGSLTLSPIKNGEIRDLATYGLALETPELGPSDAGLLRAEGVRVYLQWSLPEATVAAMAVPVWCTSSPEGLALGLKILEIPLEHQSAIRAFVQR